MTDQQLLSDFLDIRDETAFEILVARHGPMVLRTCREVLGEDVEAERAFQAVFLVLAMRAGSTRKRHSLGPWLHEAAWQVSRRCWLRARGGVPPRHLRRSATWDAPVPASARLDGSDCDLKRAVHGEIRRLPAPYRDVVVLCCLEGLAPRAATARLHYPPGTLDDCLDRGLEVLRSRLLRRGVNLPSALFPSRTPATDPTDVDDAWDLVPEALLDHTVAAAMHARSCGRVLRDGTISEEVVALVEDELRPRHSHAGALALILALAALAAICAAV